ncbi:alpha/beta hydrolase [Novosphingobium tardum]|uniref:Alpha/beta hydrolase n=1 Tax=Novosphingobium tardum TaxID=1538021 RepID=A0ABV8RQ93_9SPHN
MTEPSTRHLVNPDFLPVIDALPFRTFDHETLHQARAESGERFRALGEPVIAPQVRTVAGPGGDLELYCFDPAPGTSGRAALLHVHGGGMFLGSAREMASGPAGISAALGIPVVSVEYRLAPEAPFPAPQDDCLAALRWMSENAEELGIDSARIGILGESAGGGLAAATALMARDTGGPALAAQILVYPMLDHRTGGDDCAWRNRTTGEFVWTRSSNRFGWEALQGSYQVDDARKGWFSPALADDLSGLPPTVILTGSLDLFFDEDLDYARRLVDAGVPVELHSYPGAIHGFNIMPESSVSQAFARDMLGAASRLLGLEPRA